VTESPARVRSAPVLTAAVAIAFALFFVYDLFEAITNLTGVVALVADQNEFLIENDITPLAVPWAVLLTNLALPPLAFALAWWLGRRRSILHQALLYLLGLGVVAAVTLSLTALV
jgi:hypothetical protein